jgi:hypothetical protein
MMIAPLAGEEKAMFRFLHTALLSAALMAPIAMAPTALLAEDHHDRSYHDRDHHDDHHWNKHEDRAYRMWVKENHRRYRNFNKLRAEDQRAYWAWRHEHSDGVLRIDIR